jgi:hypothetical protein
MDLKKKLDKEYAEVASRHFLKRPWRLIWEDRDGNKLAQSQEFYLKRNGTKFIITCPLKMPTLKVGTIERTYLKSGRDYWDFRSRIEGISPHLHPHVMNTIDTLDFSLPR